MLETERLNLRWATLADARLLYELNLDPEVLRFTGDQKTKTISEAEDVIRERLEPQRQLYKMGRFLVFIKDGTFIGWCGLRYFPEKDEVDLGYRLMKKYWGKGYATEASMACLKYGFESLNLNCILAQADPQNLASIKIMMKLGMKFSGVRPEAGISWVNYEIKKNEIMR